MLNFQSNHYSADGEGNDDGHLSFSSCITAANVYCATTMVAFAYSMRSDISDSIDPIPADIQGQNDGCSLAFLGKILLTKKMLGVGGKNHISIIF